MIRPHIKVGTKGPAFPIVCISEGSHVDRAIFNCIAHILYDRPCETTEEIKEVGDLQMNLNTQIGKLLKAMPVREYKEHPTKYRLYDEDKILYAVTCIEHGDTVEALKALTRP